jgi:hypothetical protein
MTTDVEFDVDLEWEEPPALRRGPRSSDEATRAIASALQARPNAWAKIAEGSRDSALVSKIKKGTHPAFAPEGAYEATSRRDEEGDITVWARFVGVDEDETDDPFAAV